MAGAGYKLFNTGDVLTAAQVNTYLQEQVVMVFADAAARTTALSGVLAEGMVSYLKSTKVVEIYNGTAWASLDDPNAIQNTIVDAKGDLIAATANDTPARLAVGSNDTVLIADSSAATGLKWGGNWQNWTPTLSNITQGNGTVTARYRRINNTVEFFFKFVMGSTSAMGTNPTVSLPVATVYRDYLLPVQIGDVGAAFYIGFGQIADNLVYLYPISAAGTYAVGGSITATTPMTWTTTDYITVWGSYEVA